MFRKNAKCERSINNISEGCRVFVRDVVFVKDAECWMISRPIGLEQDFQ